MRLENAFDVPASLDESWRLLNDVPSVVPCMPGAELVEAVGDDAWRARLHVKLGPIALQFLADVVREEMDEAAGRVVLGVAAREAKGRGGADATIESRLSTAGVGTHVEIVTDLALRGAVAQYGRGVVADVAGRLTSQFAQCITAKLADASPEAASASAPPTGACARRRPPARARRPLALPVPAIEEVAWTTSGSWQRSSRSGRRRSRCTGSCTSTRSCPTRSTSARSTSATSSRAPGSRWSVEWRGWRRPSARRCAARGRAGPSDSWLCTTPFRSSAPTGRSSRCTRAGTMRSPQVSSRRRSRWPTSARSCPARSSSSVAPPTRSRLR